MTIKNLNSTNVSFRAISMPTLTRLIKKEGLKIVDKPGLIFSNTVSLQTKTGDQVYLSRQQKKGLLSVPIKADFFNDAAKLQFLQYHAKIIKPGDVIHTKEKIICTIPENI